jgi:hypothetical protein
MRVANRMLPFIAALAFSACSVPVYAAATAAGHWEGKIQIPEHELSIAVDLARTPTGAWIGSLSITGSTAVAIPLVKITVSDAGVQFTASLPGETSFVGTLSADAASLAGKVSSVEGAVPFQLARAGEANVKLPPTSSPSSRDFEGTWEGSAALSGQVRPVRLKISSAPDGTAIAVLVSVAKHLEIPVTTVTIQGKALALEVRSVGGAYRGVLGAGGEITGEWTEQAVRAPLTFKKMEIAK